MTLVQTRANGFGTPSLPQLLLTAMLRMLAELVQSVCSTLQMIRRRSPVIGTRETPPSLPRGTSDTNQETFTAQHRSPLALMLRRPKAVSKHEGVLTIVSQTSPSPSVSLTTSAIHLPLLRRWRTRLRGTSSTAFGGGGGSPRLRGETEGARQEHNGRGLSVRVPREGGDPVLLSQEASRITSRHSGSPPSRGTRRTESAKA